MEKENKWKFYIQNNILMRIFSIHPTFQSYQICRFPYISLLYIKISMSSPYDLLLTILLAHISID